MKNIILSFFLFFAFGFLLQAQPKGEEITIGESFSIHSSVLDEDRPYLIYLPDDYDPKGDPLAVMYLLDGWGNFHHTTGIVKFLRSQGKIPNMMVVAIPNTSNRTGDLTPPILLDKEGQQNMPGAGGADKMLSFMSDELIPHIDKSYNTNSYRMLVGHSFGALFAVHALLEKPDIFDSYISISPSMWWDNQRLVDEAENFLSSEPNLDGFFYMTMGNEGGGMLGGAMKLAALFEEKSPENFDWDFKIMEEETHGSVPHRSTYDGLEKIFEEWFSVELDKLFAEGGMAGIDKHYAGISKKLGFEFTPSEGAMNGLGYAFIGHENYEKAIDIFKENIKRFPGSYNVYDSLGEVYKMSGDTKNAIKYYKKSVDIHPGNANGIRMLQEMGVSYDPMSDGYNAKGKDLKMLVGTYKIADQGKVSVQLEDGQLVLSTDDNSLPKQSLVPVYKDGFIAKPTNFLLNFNKDDAKKVTGFTAQIGPGRYAEGKLVE